ncbi:MAG: carbamoylphosphate synthase large subunit [Lachnospiraceae bacterium]|nr:carbamoylphosphate synthase large subunit [Lachnospiraceae bacterium]
MNFIFISPQFPKTYWNFCDRLKRNGVNVLGIGDSPYDSLDEALKSSLTEYYRVDSLEDYDQAFRAVAFFSFKYGKIDWIESNNEYWLGLDARLRTDFHVTTGVQENEIEFLKEKRLMKVRYAEGKIPTARQHVVSTLESAREFIEKTGYPVIVKPNIGVGAADTYTLHSDEELEQFYGALPSIPYVMEEFITGDIRSYDAIVDSNGDPLFESMTVWPPSIADIVLTQSDLAYYVAAEVPEKLRELGRRTVKSFGVKSRFVHLEFFCLTKPKKGLGKIGDFVALEVNMRPAGGYTPDMMDFAHSTDVYQIWADMVTADARLLPPSDKEYYCAYAGRRDGVAYLHTHEEIMEKYGDRMMMQEEMPPMYWPQMGNRMYTVRLDSKEETEEFIAFVDTRI